jgi:hypothetical protein
MNEALSCVQQPRAAAAAATPRARHTCHACTRSSFAASDHVEREVGAAAKTVAEGMRRIEAARATLEKSLALQREALKQVRTLGARGHGSTGAGAPSRARAPRLPRCWSHSHLACARGTALQIVRDFKESEGAMTSEGGSLRSTARQLAASLSSRSAALLGVVRKDAITARDSRAKVVNRFEAMFAPSGMSVEPM